MNTLVLMQTDKYILTRIALEMSLQMHIGLVNSLRYNRSYQLRGTGLHAEVGRH